MTDEDEPTKNEIIPDADDGDEADQAPKAAAKKPTAKKADDEPEQAPKPKRKPAAKKVTTPKSDRVTILLEENDDIPPNGLFLGLNGRGYLLRPGEKVSVPIGIVEILENAVMSAPVVDQQTKQVIGYRDRLKYPFRKV
jgi:hypothetical protein